MKKFMISVQFLPWTDIIYDQQFFGTINLTFFSRKVEICWNFLLFYCKFEYFCYLKKCSPIFQNHKTEKKKKTPAYDHLCGLGKTFSPTRSFNLITSIKRKIQSNGMLCENSGVSMDCNNLFISCVVNKNDHGSWTLYDVNTKKMHDANSEERWKPTKFHNQIQLHNCSK